MKRAIKFLSVVLALLLSLESMTALAATIKSKSEYTGKTYTHNEMFANYDILNGIDVSVYNGTIDYDKVKADGIDFVFVRVGYTGYTKSKHSLNYDSNYKTNIKNAIKAGLKVGVYWYSQALTTAEAEAEAEKLVSVLSSYNITMPVVMDYEFAGTSSGRLDSANLSKRQMTDNAYAFLKYVDNSGYTPCIYASKNFFANYMYAEELSALYPIWLAHYTTSTDYDGDYTYWQYSSSGDVDGISGNCDMNFWYVSNTISLDDEVYTGSYIKPDIEVYNGDTLLVKDTDYTLTFENNKKVGTATATATGIGDYTGFKQVYTFNIVPEKVTGLTLTSRKTDSLTFTWNSAKGASRYKVEITDKTSNKVTIKTSKTTTYTISNLTAGHKYSVKVVGLKYDSTNTPIYGEFSKANVKHTKPGKVTKVTAKATTTTVTLSWKKQSGVTGYAVYQYSSKTDSYKKIATLKGSSTTSYKVKSLTSGKAYKFKIAAYITDGSTTKYGSRSSAVKAVTKPSSVTLKSVASKKSKRITVKWKAVKNVTGYQVQWSTYKSFSSNKKAKSFKGSTTTSATIKTSQSKKRYYVRVRSYKTISGTRYYSSWSSIKSVKTK